MMNKKYLVPILAILGCGLPVGASVVTYCNGGGCSTNTDAAFSSAVTTAGLTYTSISALTFSPGSLSGTQYTDGLTGVVFQDLTRPFLSASGVLETSISGGDTMQITIPATYTAIVLDLTNIFSGTIGFGLDGGSDYVNLSHSVVTTVGYTNIGGTDPWIITIYPYTPSGELGIVDFNLAQGQSSGGGGAQTPEVGTLLLIGTGLISMRWMKRIPKVVFRNPQVA